MRHIADGHDASADPSGGAQISGKTAEDIKTSREVGKPSRSPFASARTAPDTSYVVPSASVFRKSRVANTDAVRFTGVVMALPPFKVADTGAPIRHRVRAGSAAFILLMKMAPSPGFFSARRRLALRPSPNNVAFIPRHPLHF
jgi:hypothetical protein